MLVLRSDMTIPIARVVATRYASVEPPLRFCYFAHAYRSVRPQRGQAREMLQAGIELVGAPGPEGTAEALDACCARRSTRPGSTNYRIGLGDASLYPALLDALGVPDAARGRRSCTSSSRATSSAWSARSRRCGSAARRRDAARACRSCAAAPRCSTRAGGRRGGRPARACYERLAPRVARARDLRPRPRRGRSATTRARSSRSTTPRSARRSAAAGATTTCSGASGATCRPRAGR